LRCRPINFFSSAWECWLLENPGAERGKILDVRGALVNRAHLVCRWAFWPEASEKMSPEA
jgi:hypothetical protein